MERWPTVYDAAELVAQIKALSEKGALFDSFYSAEPANVQWCQGDVVSDLPLEIPVLNATGVAVIENLHLSGWLLLSNTCDLDRPLTLVEWAQAVPIFDLGGDDDISISELEALRRYQLARRFYVPDWDDASPRSHYMADLTMPATISREALRGARRLARLSTTGWILLHSCLVRFLARDDGRMDTA